MRTAFFSQLLLEARANPRIFLAVADLGFSVVEEFARELPGQYLNVGVAEQNMTGVAAGLAAEGYHVFTYSIANFPTFRAAEFIRNDVAYHGLSVTVVSVGGGVSYGNLGYSHHAVQDLALMRSFPNVTLCTPGDPVETRAAVTFLARHPQPSYLRLGKAGEPTLHADPLLALDGPRLVRLSGPADARKLVLAVGGGVAVADAAGRGGQIGDWAVGSLPLWGEQHRAELRRQLRDYTAIVTVEDHQLAGGFGSYVGELLGNERRRPALRSVGIASDTAGLVASQAAFHRAAGLTAEEVVKACRVAEL